MKVPDSPGASRSMEAGAGPWGGPVVAVPATVGASGTTWTASVVPVLVTVSVTVSDWPRLAVEGATAMAAEIDASGTPTTVKAFASSPAVPNGPCTRSVFTPGVDPAGTVARSVCSSTQRTSRSGWSPSQAWKA